MCMCVTCIEMGVVVTLFVCDIVEDYLPLWNDRTGVCGWPGCEDRVGSAAALPA